MKTGTGKGAKCPPRGLLEINRFDKSHVYPINMSYFSVGNEVAMTRLDVGVNVALSHLEVEVQHRARRHTQDRKHLHRQKKQAYVKYLDACQPTAQGPFTIGDHQVSMGL